MFLQAQAHLKDNKKTKWLSRLNDEDFWYLVDILVQKKSRDYMGRFLEIMDNGDLSVCYRYKCRGETNGSYIICELRFHDFAVKEKSGDEQQTLRDLLSLLNGEQYTQEAENYDLKKQKLKSKIDQLQTEVHHKKQALSNM